LACGMKNAKGPKNVTGASPTGLPAKCLFQGACTQEILQNFCRRNLIVSL